jgi:endoglycosylceramidase
MNYLILATTVLFTVANSKKVHVDPATKRLRDEYGRDLLFHGVNVIYKMAPYIPDVDEGFEPQDSLNEFDMANLKKWGMNFVRLGVMWEAVEIADGVYNYTYLDEIEKLINELGEHGIYSQIDAH